MQTTLHTIDWADAMRHDFEKAQKSIAITALSFLCPRGNKIDPWNRYYMSLAEAALRGVTVSVTLPAPTLAHPATLRNDSAADRLAQIGVTTNLLISGNLLHAKTAIVDNAIAWVGSGNMTAAAAHHNHEAYLRTTDATAVSALAKLQQLLRMAAVRAA